MPGRPAGESDPADRFGQPPSAGGPAGTVPGPPARLKRIGASYSRFVGLMKFVLPAIAGTLVILVVVWPEIRDDRAKFHLEVARIDIEDADGRKLLNARFTGTDSRDNPYTVTADTLVQDPENEDIVNLSNPKADIVVESGSWIALTAPIGQYNKNDQVLELSGGVNLFHDMGYEFRTELAIVDFRYGSAFGDARVEGQGPFGRLSSEGFLMLDGGRSIVFTGKARLVMFPSAEAAEK